MWERLGKQLDKKRSTCQAIGSAGACVTSRRQSARLDANHQRGGKSVRGGWEDLQYLREFFLGFGNKSFGREELGHFSQMVCKFQPRQSWL